MRCGHLLTMILVTLICAQACEREETAKAPGYGAGIPAGSDDQARAVSESDASTAIPVSSPDTAELLPEEARGVWAPWLGDLDGMVERRVLRVVVPYGGYQYFYEGGRPRGATYDLLQRLESFVNESLGRRHVKVHVLAIPVSRDRLVPSLLDGNADLVAADLTVTEQRSAKVAFSRPLRDGVREVVVTGPAAPALESIDDVAGSEFFVRRSSSYAEHLERLGARFRENDREAPIILAADELLEAEDILEMVNAGMVGTTIMDEYKARFWAQVFPDLHIRDDLVINDDGVIAWAMRSDSQQLAKLVDDFLRRYGKGTLVGNDTYKRYLADASRVRCANARTVNARLRKLVDSFQRYGRQYDFDWLMLAAQGYQESGLKQSRVSPAGAVGIMQIKPATAAGRNVGIRDIGNADANIHAGTKYLRFIADRYFAKPEIDSLNRWLLALAAYNAGPAKINRLRREAAEAGYDPGRWFDNVEIIVARRIGRETVTYVSNIYKYFVGYRLIEQRGRLLDERFARQLGECTEDRGD